MRILLLMLCFSLVHCSHFTMNRNEDQKTSAASDAQIIETAHYFWGLQPGKRGLVESNLCPNSRIDVVQMNMTTVDVLLTIVTAGIYAPSRATITCSK